MLVKFVNRMFDKWKRHCAEKKEAEIAEWFRGARAGRGSRVTTLPEAEHLRFAKRTYRLHRFDNVRAYQSVMNQMRENRE